MADSKTMLESAIPEHLRRPRKLQAKTPNQYQPPFPGYAARFPSKAKDLAMVIIGTQAESKSKTEEHHLDKILSCVETTIDSSPQYWEVASVTDNQGYLNEAVICYWRTQVEYDQWTADSGFNDLWQNLDPKADVGFFIEAFFPSIDRFETIFSDNNVPEGAAHMREAVSGQIQEHVYWGSMRDRLPVSQVDELVGASAAAALQEDDVASRRVRVPGRKNLTIIRSGQDWSDTLPHERQLYLDTMHPVLIKGMDFLRDHGKEVGCFDCRFMEVVDRERAETQTDKTFGLAYFDDLKNLEDWAKNHKTHLDIFGRFLQYAAELQNNVSLRLFHEVMVVEPQQQFFEYIGCHAGTGMLASL